MDVFPGSALRSALALLSFLALAGGLAPEGAAQAPDGCITDISPTAPGQPRSFQCPGGELQFFVSVPPGCEDGGCAMLVDLPGATQSAAALELNTGLAARGRSGTPRFIVISAQHNRGAGPPFFDTTSPNGDFVEVLDFLERAARVFDADRDRLHMGGFSQGGVLTFNAVCSARGAALLASAAPAAATPGEQGSANCFGAGQRNTPVPILYFSGRNDRIAPFEDQAAAAQDIVAGIGPIASAQQIDSGPNGFIQFRVVGANGRLLELIRFDNTNTLGGHCFVGPLVPNGGACNGPDGFQMGAKILDFYRANPKQGR